MLKQSPKKEKSFADKIVLKLSDNINLQDMVLLELQIQQDQF